MHLSMSVWPACEGGMAKLQSQNVARFSDGYAAANLRRCLNVPDAITIRGTVGRQARDPVVSKRRAGA